MQAHLFLLFFGQHTLEIPLYLCTLCEQVDIVMTFSHSHV